MNNNSLLHCLCVECMLWVVSRKTKNINNKEITYNARFDVTSHLRWNFFMPSTVNPKFHFVFYREKFNWKNRGLFNE